LSAGPTYSYQTPANNPYAAAYKVAAASALHSPSISNYGKGILLVTMPYIYIMYISCRFCLQILVNYSFKAVLNYSFNIY